MSRKSQEACWVITDGRAGNENPCLGLAAALGFDPVVKRIKLKAPWKQLSPYLRLGLSHAFSTDGDALLPPWPRLVLTSGRASIPASLYLRQASRKTGGPRSLTVHIQDPRIDPAFFDLVIAPRHDRLTGPNVVTTRGGLHRLTPALLAEEAALLAPEVAALPSPRVAVVIGGSSAAYKLTPDVMKGLVQQLRTLLATQGGSLLVTPSRRTGSENIALLQEGLKDLPVYLWTMEGRNPYFGMLGLADAILVTCDSANLASEACATGKPVYVISLPGGSKKFDLFHQGLRQDGFTRPFEGRVENWTYPPLDDRAEAVARVQALIRSC